MDGEALGLMRIEAGFSTSSQLITFNNSKMFINSVFSRAGLRIVNYSLDVTQKPFNYAGPPNSAAGSFDFQGGRSNEKQSQRNEVDPPTEPRSLKQFINYLMMFLSKSFSNARP